MVVYKATEFTPEGAAFRGIKWEEMVQAIERIRLFKLVEGGDFTYAELGAALPDGTIPYRLIAEHLIIKEIYQQARESK